MVLLVLLKTMAVMIVLVDRSWILLWDTVYAQHQLSGMVLLVLLMTLVVVIVLVDRFMIL